MKRIPLYLAFLFCLPVSLKAQYFSTGQDPAAVRWLQIKTGSFRLLFPESFHSHSQDLIHILELTARHETKTLNAKVPRIPVLLHTSSCISNGLTVWAPRRIELYTCPPQDTYAEAWLEQLALHEYRHAVQTSKMNRGFTRALYYLFGEQITGAVLGLYIPRWFLEGDATVTETALSHAGRGRVASFAAPLRAQLLQKGIYPYDLATMGSYKTFTPDPYVLGYHLVAGGRKQYGFELWDRTLDKVARLPFMIVPFNAGIKQQTGLWKSGLYRETMQELLVEWQQQEDASWQSNYNPVTLPDPANYTIWDRPQFLDDSTILSARWSNEDVARLVMTGRNGRNRTLIRLGPYQPGSLSVARGTAVWTEYRPDIRWGNRSYSVIRILSVPPPVGAGSKPAPVSSADPNPVETGHAPSLRDITCRSRYFAPALSPDGRRIATVRVDLADRSSIDVLDVATGSIQRSFPAPEGGLFLQPAWSPDGRKIAFLMLTAGGKSLWILDLADSTRTRYLAPSCRDVSGPPLFFRNYLLFMAGYNGIENIYAIDTLTRKLLQVTSARFRATDPSISPDGNTLAYSDYCADGNMVVSREADPLRWIELDTIPDHTFELAEEMARQEGVNIQDSIRIKYEVRSTKYEVGNTKSDLPLTKSPRHHGTTAPLHHDSTGPQNEISPYRKAAHLFDVHSWAPVSIDASNLTLKPGVSLFSQNLLSTAFAGAGYEYDLSESTGRAYINFTYEGWFPVIDLRYSFGKRAGTGQYTNTGQPFRYTWNESSLQATVSVPLNLSRGIWYRRIQPAVGTTWIYVIHDRETPEQFTKGSVNTLDYRLYMYNYIRSNHQDVYPRWGQNLDLRYRHTPFAGNDLGAVLGVSSNLYFPGLFRHHGIRIYSGYQRRWDHPVYGYQFANLLPFPRGTPAFYSPQMISLSAGYKFPFLRLDASLGSVLYLKRFTLNLFYDRTHGWEKNVDIFAESAGFELTSEVHILRFLAPIELGIQGAWLPEEGRWNWRFLWGVSL